MKKVEKGSCGYLDYQKKAELIKVIIAFALVLAIFITGYVTTKSRINLFTMVAILGCLPACRFLTGLLTRLPYRSVPEELYSQVEGAAGDVDCIYDLVFTTYDKIMPVSCMALSGNVACGYAASDKTDIPKLEKHIHKMLADNGQGKVTVKVFKELPKFLARLKEMAAKEEQTKMEAAKGIILNISL